MSTGEEVGKTARSSRRIWIAVAVIAAIAVCVSVGAWIFREQRPSELSGRVLVAADPGVTEGQACMTFLDGYRLAEGADVSLYAKTTRGDLGDQVGTTTLGSGSYARTADGMACAFEFSMPRPPQTDSPYRLTVTTRKTSVDVQTHTWDFPAATIFGSDPIDVEL